MALAAAAFGFETGVKGLWGDLDGVRGSPSDASRESTLALRRVGFLLGGGDASLGAAEDFVALLRVPTAIPGLVGALPPHLAVIRLGAALEKR